MQTIAYGLNALEYMGQAKRNARQLGWDKPTTDALIAKMMQGDYDHLVAAFNEAFKDIMAIGEREERDEEDDYDDEDF